MIGSVRLSGRLDVAALTQAFSTIRTARGLADALCVLQWAATTAHRSASRLLAASGFERLSSSRTAARAGCLVNEEAARPFNLAAGPLLRIKLVKLSSCEYAVLLTVHHIISDGWSMGVLVKEVATLYRAYSTGQPSPLPELSSSAGLRRVAKRLAARRGAGRTPALLARAVGRCAARIAVAAG